jgi:hypothetical protein
MPAIPPSVIAETVGLVPGNKKGSSFPTWDRTNFSFTDVIINSYDPIFGVGIAGDGVPIPGHICVPVGETRALELCPHENTRN